MKYPIILLSIILFSCSKQEVKQQSNEVVDYNIPLQSKRKNNPPPPPTPPPTTGGKVIYVDFDGEQVASFQWGYFYATPSALTPAQRTEVINYSAAHYYPYNVTVTSNRALYDATPLANKVKIIVTDSSIRGAGSTGVAIVNNFGTEDQIAWVFSANLYNNTKYVADIVSHESGHTLGLYHQTVCTNGVVTLSYRDGVIMGSPYYTYPAVWATGTTYSCLTQNDHQHLLTKLGAR